MQARMHAGPRARRGGGALGRSGADGGTRARRRGKGTRLAGLSPGLLVWLCVVILALILD